MTAQSSRIDMRNFGKYFRYKLGQLKGYGIIQTVLSLISFPLFAVAIIMNIIAGEELNEASSAWREYCHSLGIDPYGGSPALLPTDSAEYIRYSEAMDMSSLWSTIAFFIMFLCIVALVMLVFVVFVSEIRAFRWLYKRETADMDYALPVSGDARFWGDFCAVNVISVLPYGISSIITTIIVYTASGVPAEYINMLKSMLALPWTGFLAILMFIGFNLAIITQCGKKGQAAAMPIILNLAIPAVVIIGGVIVKACAYGYGDISYADISAAALPISPIALVIGAVLKTVGGVELYFAYAVETTCILELATIVISIIASAVYAALAWLSARNRAADSVGEAYVRPVVRHVFHVITQLAVVLALTVPLIMTISDKSESGKLTVLMWFVMATLVTYLSLEVTSVGTKKFGFTLLRYVGVTALCCGITMALMFTDGFGQGSKPPVKGTIESFTYDYIGGSKETCSFVQEESIEKALEIHAKMPTEKPYSGLLEGLKKRYLGFNRNGIRSYSDNTSPMISMEYYLKDGTQRVYHYSVDEEFGENFLREIFTSESILQYYDFLNVKGSGRSYVDVTGYHLRDFTPFLDNGEFTPLERFSAQEIYDALVKDCENITYEQYRETRAGEYSAEILLRIVRESFFDYEIGDEFEMQYSVTIYPWYENTIAVLKSHGIEVSFGVSPEEYASAFLIKLAPVPEGEDPEYFGYINYNYSKRRLVNNSGSIGALIPFALIGDESFERAFVNREAETNYFSDKDGNEVTLAEAIKESGAELTKEQIDCLKGIESDAKNYFENYASYMSAVKLTREQLTELIPKCGTVYCEEPPITEPMYYLWLVNVEEGKLEEAEEKDYWTQLLYFPLDEMAMAEELFNSLAG